MSNIKARFYESTGYEFFDKAKEIDKKIWDFIKHEYKNKSKKDQGSEVIPVRYWDTHAKPLHQQAWRLVSEVRAAFDIYPYNEDELKEKKQHLLNAIICCDTICDYLGLIRIELNTINDEKLDPVFDLITEEIKMLRQVRQNAKVLNNQKRM